MPEWAMDAMTSLLGCELCQFACPLNDGAATLDEVPEEFALERLLRGEQRPALTIVGKNLNAGGRLIAHACVMAAKGNRCDLLPLIRILRDDSRPGVRTAAAYAISYLQDATIQDRIDLPR